MERHFDEDLRRLKDRVLYMGRLACEMVRLSIQALSDRNDALTQKVFDLEKTVNSLHIDIDERSLELIALHQPMANDLRFLAVAMKINTELERVADQAVNAAQTCYYHLFKESGIPKQTQRVLEMAKDSEGMIIKSLQAFNRGEIDLARWVIQQEPGVNRKKMAAISDFISLIAKNPPQSKVFVDLILLSKNYERIADHATNVAEEVIFMVSGEDIRHKTPPPLSPAA